MRDPRAAVRVIGHDRAARVGGQKVQVAGLIANGIALLGGQGLEGRRDDAVLVILEVAQRELVAKGGHHVGGQLDGGVLVAAVHLDVPGFLLVGNKGDVDLAAAVAVDEAAKDLDSLARSGTLAGHEVDGGELGQAVLNQGVRRERLLVRERGDGHEHRDALLVGADRSIAAQVAIVDSAIHGGGRGVAVGGCGQLGKHRIFVVDGHRAAGLVVDVLGDLDVIAPNRLAVVGLGHDGRAVGAGVCANIDCRASGGRRGKGAGCGNGKRGGGQHLLEDPSHIPDSSPLLPADRAHAQFDGQYCTELTTSPGDKMAPQAQARLLPL